VATEQYTLRPGQHSEQGGGGGGGGGGGSSCEGN